MKNHLVSAIALLIAISPVAAEARCMPNNAVIAAKAVPAIQYKNTTIDGMKVFVAPPAFRFRSSWKPNIPKQNHLAPTR
ncbi:hypothetical protein QO004_000951 [Rhizobium mesoamericanum]|uniref:hypothetical protein n=1 Tax=Rhizobium mesoamericanum TaxID=1079800 RepID=UPI002786CBEC|nr:hypothetical protein [Rhizobium mesoamericanum]MDQ0559173.1 hypothetical protein [Rhizobium mesoamericanum]